MGLLESPFPGERFAGMTCLWRCRSYTQVPNRSIKVRSLHITLNVGLLESSKGGRFPHFLRRVAGIVQELHNQNQKPVQQFRPEGRSGF
jgi:hypothetical protein